MPEIRREIIGREGGTGTHGENGPAIEDKTCQHMDYRIGHKPIKDEHLELKFSCSSRILEEVAQECVMNKEQASHCSLAQGIGREVRLHSLGWRYK